MKILDKIYNFIKNKKNNNKKIKVLIKSRFGLPSVRICGTALVDSCALNDCGGFGLTIMKNEENEQEYDLMKKQTVEIKDPILKNNFNNLFFRIENQEFKQILNNIDGIITTTFGIALSNNHKNQCECLRVEYNQEQLKIDELFKIYSSIKLKNKEVFYQNEDEKKYFTKIKNSISTDIVLSHLDYFEE